MEEDLVMDVAFARNRENTSESASREARFAPRRNIFNLPCFSINNINRVVVLEECEGSVSVCLDVILVGKNSNSKLLINLCFKMRFDKSFLIATVLHC